jgi:hypothetical protein
MLAPLVAALVWADRKLDIDGRGGGSAWPLKWAVLGTETANREFD